MTRQDFIKFLDDSNVDENTHIFALNCFDSGRKSQREDLVKELKQMPLNDTANSIAIWIGEQE
jgi:hypothetical protein